MNKIYCNNIVNKRTYMQNINKLIGKRVLFFDLETTGFPARVIGKYNADEYFDYTDNTKYNESRLIQIGWYYSDNFIKFKDCDIDINKIKSVIRKPFDFYTIPDTSVNIHGISYEKAINEGIYIKKIMNGEFGNCIMNCDYIVAYNAYFDFSILANEIHRIKNDHIYNKLMQLKDNNVVCMMAICNDYMNQYIKQSDMYGLLYGTNANAHRANHDVYMMLKILKYIIDNPQPNKILSDQYKINSNKSSGKPENSGTSWRKDEEAQLRTLYVDKNDDIKSIARVHKRSELAIKAKLDHMNILRDIDKIDMMRYEKPDKTVRPIKKQKKEKNIYNDDNNDDFGFDPFKRASK